MTTLRILVGILCGAAAAITVASVLTDGVLLVAGGFGVASWLLLRGQDLRYLGR